MAGPSQTLNLSTTRMGEAHVVRVRGEVDLQTAPQLRALLTDLLKQTPKHLIVDLSGASYMDSSGVGTVVFLKREIERGGGRMILSGLQSRVRSVFEITQLDRFFTIVGTVDEALRR